jgi:beta-ureidopropionase / N-carbamoyl-L-amino-acid hydrolase
MGNGEKTSLASAIDGNRLWRRHMELARIGATARGGVNRQALSPEDGKARAMLLGWAAARGFVGSVDPIGNLFIRRPGRDAAAAPVVTGSHLDTQPTGGKFDGIYGVLAGLEALEAMSDLGLRTRLPIDLVVWTNEEGSRFPPTTMGSAVFAGALPLDRTLATRDAAGVSVDDALAATLAAAPVEGRRPLGFPIAAYIEAHIEQGPILEATGKMIGAVTVIQGLRWFSIEILGQAAHAGTTPRRRRRDAFSAAVAMVAALERLTADETDTVRFTVGRVEVAPNSPNTVPSRAFFTVDLRHPDAATLARLGDQIEAVCRANARGCEFTVAETIRSEPAAFSPAIVSAVTATARRLGLSHMEIVSGATHDAKFMTGRCPSGMIFIPCREGVSHSEEEDARPEHMTAGARVLAEVLAELSNSAE